MQFMLLLILPLQLVVGNSENFLFTCLYDGGEPWAQFQCFSLISFSSTNVTTYDVTKDVDKILLFDVMRECMNKIQCNGSWSGWKTIQSCDSLCKSGQVFRKRLCKQPNKNPRFSKCPLQEKRIACKRKACQINDRRLPTTQQTSKDKWNSSLNEDSKHPSRSIAKPSRDRITLLIDTIKVYLQNQKEKEVNPAYFDGELQDDMQEQNLDLKTNIATANPSEGQIADALPLADDEPASLNAKRDSQTIDKERRDDEETHLFDLSVVLTLGVVGGVGWIGFWACCVFNLVTRSSFERRNRPKRSEITSFYENAGPAFPPTRSQSDESQNEFLRGQDLDSRTVILEQEQLKNWNKSLSSQSQQTPCCSPFLSDALHSAFKSTGSKDSYVYASMQKPQENSSHFGLYKRDFPDQNKQYLSFDFDNESETENEVFKSDASDP